MHKQELIEGLKRFVADYETTDKVRWRGQKAFAQFLIHYLGNLKIASDEKYDFWRIESCLPELLVDAFEKLRTESDDATVRFRSMYKAETGREVPNITDLGESSILEQGSAVQSTLQFMFRAIIDQDWVEHEIDAYCNAQIHVLQQTFDKFLRRVFRKGMYEVIQKSNGNGMSGQFGDTELRTFGTAGRLMFAFAKRIDRKKPNYLKKGKDLFCNEHSVSFVGEDDDPLCLSAGIQSVHADFRTALDMIDDVIKRWPADEVSQRKIFRSNKKVSIF